MVTRHASVGDLPPGMPPTSAEDLRAVPSAGATIAAIVAGGLGGAALGEGLYRVSPRLAWLAWLGLCLMLYCVATVAGRRGTRRWNLLTILGLGFGVLVSTIFVWGESVPRATTGLTLARNLILLPPVVVLGAATPIALVLVALRRHLHRPPDAAQPLDNSLAPLAISIVLGVASVAIGLAVVFGTLLVVRDAAGPMQIAALTAASAAAPILVWPLWVAAYEWLVAQWRVDPPDALRVALATLQTDTGTVFTRVLCLAASYGQGRSCQIVHRPGRSVLIISKPLADSIPPRELLAVLAHEAAHVHLGHTGRKMLWGTLGAAFAVGASVALGWALGAVLPRSLALTRVLAGVLPVVFARMLWEYRVVREHEREADAFAVRTAGAEAMLGALARLGGGGPPSAIVHRRWTTHGTLEDRHARIRAMADVYP